MLHDPRRDEETCHAHVPQPCRPWQVVLMLPYGRESVSVVDKVEETALGEGRERLPSVIALQKSPTGPIPCCHAHGLH